MAPFRQARLISVVLLFATLAAGFLIGVAWSERGSDAPAEPMQAVEPDEQAREAENTDDPGRDSERERRRPVIFELNLDSAQRARLETQRAYFSEAFDGLNEEMRREEGRRRGQLRGAAWDSIRAVLRPDQLATYDSLLTARFSRGNRNDTTRSDGDRNDGRDRSRRPDGPGGDRPPHIPKYWKDH